MKPSSSRQGSFASGSATGVSRAASTCWILWRRVPKRKPTTLTRSWPSTSLAFSNSTRNASWTTSSASAGWSQRREARAWLTRVRDSSDDLAALAREGARRLKHRVLSRAELRSQTRETARRLMTLINDAEAGLPPVEVAS